MIAFPARKNRNRYVQKPNTTSHETQNTRKQSQIMWGLLETNPWIEIETIQSSFFISIMSKNNTFKTNSGRWFCICLYFRQKRIFVPVFCAFIVGCARDGARGKERAKRAKKQAGQGFSPVLWGCGKLFWIAGAGKGETKEKGQKTTPTFEAVLALSLTVYNHR